MKSTKGLDPHSPSLLSREAGYREYSLISLIGALLSIGASGFVPGHNNNVFHLPILAALYDLPQFADDPFVQSLRFYSSGLWRILSGFAPDHAFPLLFCLFVGSRLIFFSGALACARLVGITSVRACGIFAVLLTFSGMLRDLAFAGQGGLLIMDFTHSEVANGTTLWTIFLITRRRYAASFAANGFTFFLNAFMAVWNAVPIALILVMQLMEGTLPLRRTSYRMAIGGLFFLLIASPVIFTVLHNPEAALQQTFDYRTYLLEYFPGHFFISETPRYEIKQLIFIFVIGIIALVQLGAEAHSLLLAFIGYSLIWLFGTVAPAIFHGNAVILLHLLRVSADVQIFAAVAVAALTTRWLEEHRGWRSHLWGPLLALTTTGFNFALSIPIMLAGRLRHRIHPPFAIVAVTFGILLFYAWPLRVVTKISASRHGYQVVERWRDVALWARDHSLPNAIFLIPIGRIQNGPYALGKDNPEQQRLNEGSEGFEYFSRRRIWVDYKNGGVVMWYPSYYGRWKKNLLDVMELPSLPARLDYARRNKIDFVVDSCPAPHIKTDWRPVYRADYLCVYRSGLYHP